MKNIKLKIPKEVSRVTQTLEKAGFEAYLVGGCVRDLLSDRKPKDWDITTNAKPENILELFEHTFYENEYGTVGVVSPETTKGVSGETLDETLKTIEITPYRLESKYSDSRHPDAVVFSDKLEDDLKRRDFTINAMAYSVSGETLVDLYNGQKDLKDKIIRAVGNPEDRFSEDALRLLRAVRLATELSFTIDNETEKAIVKQAKNLKNISQERIRDEFIKILMTDAPMDGLILTQKLGLLKYIIPELEKGMGEKQKGAHIYTIWEHNLRTLQHSADKNFPLHIRLASLLHDIAKPHTKRWHKEKKEWTFYGHDVVGKRVSREILERLRFPKQTIEIVTKLVRNHLFFSDIDKITLSAVRRIICNVGPENVWDLMKLRTCDRIGMGRPKEKPYRLRKYMAMIEEAMKAPVSVKMLKIDGKRLMDVSGETPGPKIGFVLNALLEDVLDDPALNTTKYLEKRAQELIKLPENELKALGEKGKEKKEREEEKEIKAIRARHWVK
ncbi:MAG: HD domain-containing protein [Candidatus Pacebacteria bacterium]|nr:HD domain-containing protein [Candidatus Paceibacterota bacterium]